MIKKEFRNLVRNECPHYTWLHVIQSNSITTCHCSTNPFENTATGISGAERRAKSNSGKVETTHINLLATFFPSWKRQWGGDRPSDRQAVAQQQTQEQTARWFPGHFPMGLNPKKILQAG